MSESKPFILREEVQSVPGYPSLCFTHEQGTERIVDRASGIDIRTIERWVRDGRVPRDVPYEAAAECVRYQSDVDAAEVLCAMLSCTSPGERFHGQALAKFRLLPRPDRELIARLFAEPPAYLHSEPPRLACDCNAPFLRIGYYHGGFGRSRCTKCFTVWDSNPYSDPLPNKVEWSQAPTYADALDQIR
jgi:hypothetical protein